MKKARFVSSFAYGLEDEMVIEDARKFSRNNLNNLILNLIREYVKKEQNMTDSNPLGLRYGDIQDKKPEIFCSFEELDEWIRNIPFDKNPGLQGWFRHGLDTANKEYQDKKFPPQPSKREKRFAELNEVLQKQK